MSPQPKILLTGATGYIGGTILTHLLDSENPTLKDETITALVRGADRVGKLRNVYGSRVKPELYESLDDIDRTIEVASQHDIVINTTLGFHPQSAAALVHGLAKRKKATGRDVFMIHTSGTSNLADRPISGDYVESDPERIFDDEKDDIYQYEKERNEKEPYGQRTSELGVIDAGIQDGVNVLVIMSPTIYGIGTGHFNRSSIQVPEYVKATLKNGHGVIVGKGKAVWDNVHVEDLAELYELCLLDMIHHGANLPYGKKGIIFSGTQRHAWLDIAQGVAQAAYDAGAIKSPEVKSVSLEEANKMFGMAEHGGSVELGLSSNSRTEAGVGKRLGWKPTRGKEAWLTGFREEVDAELAKRK